MKHMISVTCEMFLMLFRPEGKTLTVESVPMLRHLQPWLPAACQVGFSDWNCHLTHSDTVSIGGSVTDSRLLLDL